MVQLLQYLAERTAEEPAVLATIVESSGSTPRGAGARMAVTAGDFLGTVGGGAVEYRAQQTARELLTRGASRLQRYHLGNNDAGGLGMVCGGDVTLHYQYLSWGAKATSFFQMAVELAVSGEATCLATDFSPDGAWSMRLARPDGTIVGELGGPAFLSQGDLFYDMIRLLRLEGGCRFVQPLASSGRVYVFGGGHISRELVPLLDYLSFPCTVVDSAAEFADPAHFPQSARVVHTEFDTALDRLQVEAQDYVVILTRGHLYDFAVLSQALGTPARYIGMIGSKNKIAATYERLRARGFGDEDLERVHAPIGLAIGGDTPREIAVSIAAQLVGVRSGKLG